MLWSKRNFLLIVLLQVFSLAAHGGQFYWTGNSYCDRLSDFCKQAACVKTPLEYTNIVDRLNELKSEKNRVVKGDRGYRARITQLLDRIDRNMPIYEWLSKNVSRPILLGPENLSELNNVLEVFMTTDLTSEDFLTDFVAKFHTTHIVEGVLFRDRIAVEEWALRSKLAERGSNEVYYELIRLQKRPGSDARDVNGGMVIPIVATENRRIAEVVFKAMSQTYPGRKIYFDGLGLMKASDTWGLDQR